MKYILILILSVAILSCSKESQTNRRITGEWELKSATLTSYDYWGNGGHKVDDITCSGTVKFSEDNTGTAVNSESGYNPFPSNFNWTVKGETMLIDQLDYTDFTVTKIDRNTRKLEFYYLDYRTCHLIISKIK